MAPPVTYNTANSSYSRVDLTRTNTSSNKAAAEVALAKAMLTRDISDFNNHVSNTSDMQLINNDTFNNLLKKNLMVNHQENCLGTVFALAAEHIPESNSGLYTTTTIDQYDYASPIADSIMSVDGESASYYHSGLHFNVDSSEMTFYDAQNETSVTKSSNPNFKVDFTSNNNDKAVNSIYSTSDRKNPLTIFASSFNATDALFSEKQISQDSSNAYSAGDNLTNKLSDVRYTSGSNNFPLYTITKDTTAANNQFFFGSVKVQQENNRIVIDDRHPTEAAGTTTSVAGSDGSTLAVVPKFPDNTGSNNPPAKNEYPDGPINVSDAQFRSFFSGDDQSHILDGYKIVVSSDVEGGGYALNNVENNVVNNYDFTLNDTDLKRSIPYMEACATAGNNFTNAAHSFDIVNGDLVKNQLPKPVLDADGNLVTVDMDMNHGSPNANIFASGPMDMAETLNSTEYKTSFKVRSYFTKPSLNFNAITSTNPSVTYSPVTLNRSEAIGGSKLVSGSGISAIYEPSDKFTDFRVVYNSQYEESDYNTTPLENANYPWTEGTFNLDSDRRQRYYDKFDITTVMPSTTVDAINTSTNTDSYFYNAKTIGQNNGFVAVVQDNKLGMNTVADYTFTSSSSALTAAANDVILIKLENMQEMANENSLYTIDNSNATALVDGTNVSAIGSNINLTGINAKDLRIKLTAKTELSGLSNYWTFQKTEGTTLYTNVRKPSIFGDKIYDITANTANTVPLTFEVKSNGAAANRDALDLYTEVKWTWDDVEHVSTISEDTMNPQYSPVANSDIATVTHEYTKTVTSGSIFNVIKNAVLKRCNQGKTFTPQFPIQIGAYTNLKVVGTILTVTDRYHYLEDANGNRLSDHYLTYFVHNVNGSKPTATRTIEGSKMATVTLSGSDLYGFNAVVEKWSDACGNWFNTSDTLPFDPAFNNRTVFTLTGDNGTIEVTADISNMSTVSESAVLDQPAYYISLSTANNASSYHATGYRWHSTDMTNFSYDVFSADSESIPSGYTAIPLSTMVEFTSPVSGNYNTQPNVTITVTDGTSGSGFEWAKFVTSNDNATSSFNVWYAAHPVFKVTESYGITGFTDSNTFSLMAYDETNLPIVDGILLRFNKYTAASDNGIYRLLGDYIEAILYTGYDDVNGTGNYRTVTEVTPASGAGLVIGQGDTKCRHIELAYYRGNSVIYSAGDASTTSTFEEFVWNRIPTTVSFKLVVGPAGSSTTYIDNTFDGTSDANSIYAGWFKNSNNLLQVGGTTSFDLGLLFGSSYSRLATGTLSYNSNINAYTKSLPIEVTFGSYKWNSYNPDKVGSSGSPFMQDNGSQTGISTSHYEILNLGNLKFVASKVKVSAKEAYSFENAVQPLRLYYSSTFLGNVSVSTVVPSWSEFQVIDKLQFADGPVAIKVPGTGVAGPPSTGTDSWLSITRNSSAVTSHTGYFVLPRPQFAVTTVKRNGVSNLNFVSTSATKLTRFFNMDMSATSNDGWTTTNARPFSADSYVNNMTINLKSSLRYVDSIPTTYIYVPSNKVTIRIALGSNINNFNNYAEFFNASIIATLYDGYIHELVGNLEGYTNSGATTYISGSLNSNNCYDIKFNQPITPFTSISSAELEQYGAVSGNELYGSLGAGGIQNIRINNISPFITPNAVGQRMLPLYPGDSVKFTLYGHTYEKDNSTNALVAKFVKYTSGIGFDFQAYTNLGNNMSVFQLKNFKLTATMKYTATVQVREAQTILPVKPFNLIDDCEAAATALTSLSWVEDTTAFTRLNNPEPTVRQFDLTALSKSGVGALAGVLGATYNSPFRVTVFSYPNFVDIRSRDGAPVYVVDGFGTLRNNKTHTKVVELVSSSSTPNTFADEYTYYNNLIGNAL